MHPFTLWLLELNDARKKWNEFNEYICVGGSGCSDWDVQINHRTRRKKKMPGEQALDEGLSAKVEARRVMQAALDSIMNGMDSRFQQLTHIHETFGFLIKIESFFSDNEVDPGLQTKCLNFAKAYPDDVDGDRLAEEIQDCRALVGRHAASVALSPLGILKFIVSYGGNDVFPNLKVALQILLTLSTSVAGCERSFSKLKLILTYLRANMTETRLTNLAILSIQRETVQHVDFSTVIDQFSTVKARKVLM
jgi:hypothetical protein